MELPDTCYVDSGGAGIAYQEFGSGAIELAFVMFDAASHLEVLWEEPRVTRIFERLGRFARVVMFDRRGTGLSDPAGDALTLEAQTDDLFAVLDAVGFERPAFVGASASAGRLAVFAAATHPERVSALVLIGSSVTGSRYWDPDRVEKFERLIASVWGTGRYAVMYVPSLADDARFLRWLGRFERNALSPGMARRLLHLSVGWTSATCWRRSERRHSSSTGETTRWSRSSVAGSWPLASAARAWSSLRAAITT